jgi:hypothetical protein
MTYHLAQINIGWLIAPIDDPKIAEFVAQLGPINALADKAPGFVWRLQSESGNATDIRYNDDPSIFLNMSVWESIGALRDFAYRPITPASFVTAPNGLRRWTGPAIAFGGSRRATFPPSPRAASASSTTSNTARRRFPSGFRSTSPSPPMRAYAPSCRLHVSS